METIFHPKASADLVEISGRYADVSAKVYGRFMAEMDRAVAEISKNPSRFHFDPSGLRRLNLKGFPYHLLFEEMPDYAWVVVVKHDRRDPAFGLDRI